jgi:hypothetical protein
MTRSASYTYLGIFDESKLGGGRGVRVRVLPIPISARG